MQRLLATSFVLLAAAACSSEDGATADRGTQRASKGPPAFESFPPETQAFMKAGLHQFSEGDPRWAETRAEWIAKGPDEADFLVQTMWAALLQFQAINEPAKVEKARHELAMIGEPSIPLMAQCLAGGTVGERTDPKTGERKDIVVDDIARGEASEILGLIGAPAAGAVKDALSRAASK